MSNSSWFANGSNALSSGLSLVSSIVNEVREVATGDQPEPLLDNGTGVDPEAVVRMQKEIAERDARIKELTLKIESAASSKPVPSDLEQRNTLLQEKLAKAVGHLKPLVEENRSLKAKIQTLETNPNKDTDSADQQHLEHLHAQIQALKESLKIARTEASTLSTENQTLTTLNNQSKTEIEALHLELNTLKSAANSPTNVPPSNDSSLRVEMLEAETEQLRALNSKLESNVSQLNADLSKSVAENKSLHEAQVRLSRGVEEMKHEVSTLLTDNEGLKNAKLGLLEEVETLNLTCSGLADDNGRLQERVRLAEGTSSTDASKSNLELEHLQKEIHELRAAQVSAGETHQRAQENLTKLKNKLKQVIEANKALQQELKEAREAPGSVVDNSVQSAVDGGAQKSVDSAQLDAALEENASLKEEQLRLTQQLHEAKEKESEIQDSLDQANNSIQSLHEKIKTIQQSSKSQIESLNEELQFLQSEIESLQSDTLESGKLAKESEARMSELSAQLQTANELSASLEQQLRESSMKVENPDAGASGVNELEQQVLSLNSEIAILKSTLEDSREQVSVLTLKLKESVESGESLQPKTTELAELVSQLSNTVSALETDKANIMAKNAELTGQITELTELAAFSENEIAELQNQLSEKDTLIQTLEDKIQQSFASQAVDPDTQTRITELMTECCTLTQELEHVKATHEETLSTLENCQNELQLANSANLEHAYEIRHLHDLESGLMEQVARLKETAAKEKQEFEEERKQLDLLVEEVGQVLGRISKTVEVVERDKLSAAQIYDCVDVGSFEAIPMSLKACLNRLKLAVDVSVNRPAGAQNNADSDAAYESMKTEYEQMLVDLNVELEEKAHSLKDVQTALDVVTSEKERVLNEHNVLMVKVKGTLAPKLQEEMDSNRNLRIQVDDLTLQIANLNDEKSLLKQQLTELATLSTSTNEPSSGASDELTAQLQEELTALQAEHEKLTRKLTALQHHMAESEEAYTQDLLKSQSTIDEYKIQLDSLERERETWEAMAADGSAAVGAAEESAAEARREAEEARVLLDEAVRGRERDLVSLGNLQDVLEEFQASKQAEIDRAVEVITKQLNAANQMLEEYKIRAREAEEKLESVDTNAPSSSILEAQLQERNLEIGKLRGKVISLETYLSEAIRRASSADNQVDRRLISNLIVQFMATQRGDSKRFEMLSVIASVLKLNDEDKVKIGLLRRIGGGSGGMAEKGGSTPRSPVGDSITDLWISFLIKEAGIEGKDAAAAAGASTGAAVGENARESVAEGQLSESAVPPKRPSSAMFFGWGGLESGLLVVLDLNGTLIDRLSKGPERKLAYANPLCPRDADLTLNQNRVFLRPYLDVFLKYLLENFHVAAWTSATPKNAHPLTEFIFEPFGGSKCLEFVWDRERCIIEPTPTNKYNSHNTILLDDSASKSCRAPLNHLLILTFSVGDVTVTPNCDQDSTLISTISYLDGLLESFDGASDAGGANAWSVQTHLSETPLFIVNAKKQVELRSEAHLATISADLMKLRHRGGVEKVLLGGSVDKVVQEQNPKQVRQGKWSSSMFRNAGETNDAETWKKSPIASSKGSLSSLYQQKGASKGNLVLDLNGTLVDRLTKQHERQMASQNALCPKESDLTLERCRVFLRPYLDVFLRFLLDNFHVAVWTSAVAKNAHPMTEFIMKPFGGADALEFVWDRDQCILDPIPKKPYNTIKDLRLIWRESQNSNLSNNETFDDTLPDANLSIPFTPSHVWNETNTILLDDSASKSCRTPFNHLLVPTFSVWDLKATPNCDHDTTLLATMSYLRSLLKNHDDEMSSVGSASDDAEKAPWSVQTYLTHSPLYVATSEEEIEMASETHAVGIVEESMLQQRHRGGGDKELLGETAGTLSDEWYSYPSNYEDRRGNRTRWTDDKRYSEKKTKVELDEEPGRTHNRWADDYQGGPLDGVVKSGDNQRENQHGDARNGPAGEDVPSSELKLSRRARRRLRKQLAQQEAQVGNETQVAESIMPEVNKSEEVVDGKEENELGAAAPRFKRKRPKLKRRDYDESEKPSRKKRVESPAGGRDRGSSQDDWSVFSICSVM
ncbi:hypothetical protein HDU81_007419 [Chytriomyces hyalinus]|nr:hypothetical protein HDU81_007419 [Chytriomyces hyalinus]